MFFIAPLFRSDSSFLATAVIIFVFPSYALFFLFFFWQFQLFPVRRRGTIATLSDDPISAR
jgi:hypothetical protein